MKTLLTLIMLSCLTASAQFRYNLYTFSIATNASIASNAITTINSAVDVGSGTEATVQVAFKQHLPIHSSTNDIVTVWQSSLDGTRFTNEFTFALKAQATTNEVWDRTNFAVKLPWLRLVNITNTTGAIVTNYSVKVGQKIGL